MEKFLFENEVDGMRARDLRNLLIQRLGVDPSLISRIIDREELKRMVTSIVYEKIQQQSREDYISLAYKASFVVGLLTVLYLCRNIIWSFMLSVSDMLSESTYKTAKKSKLLIYNLKKKKYTAALALFASFCSSFATISSTDWNRAVCPSRPLPGCWWALCTLSLQLRAIANRRT